MSLVQHLREFVTERLTAAAAEIFGVFEKTIVEYEEEIDRQRRLLDIVWKPEIRLHRTGLSDPDGLIKTNTELQQQHVSQEEGVLADHQLWNQERNSSLDQEDPEPPQIKEEQEELCSSQEGEQLGLKQETDPFMLTPTYEERDHSDAEPISDQQLLSHSSAVAESQDQEGSQHGDSGSASNAEPERRHHKDTSQSNSVDNSPLSETHWDTHTGKKTVKCGICGKAFRFKCLLKKHLRIHTGERPYSCERCGKSFKRRDHLSSHVRTHTIEKSPHSNGVDTSPLSETHCDTLTGKKPFKCDTCGKAFRWKSQLNRHLTVHSEDRPHSCNTCGKKFKQTSELNAHLRLHTGEKPYSCETCGMGFKRSHHLSRHMRHHTGEKPYLCNTCGKRFTERGTLNDHLRIHTGEKPFVCNTCGKRYSEKSSFRKHMRQHMGENPHV